MRVLGRDLRFALRRLVRDPAFAVIVVVTLGLGIGANTVIFSVVNGMALKPLGYPHEEGLVQIFSTKPAQGWERSNICAVDFMDWRAQSASFVDMGVCINAGYNFTGEDGAERVTALRASASLLPVLGIEARLGRIFGPEEDQPGKSGVLLLSDGFWRRRFGGDAGIVNQLVHLDGEPYTVIGVLPAELDRARGSWGKFDIWVPWAYTPEHFGRGDHSYSAYGRLKTGVELAAAQTEMEGIAARLAQEHPLTSAGWSVNLTPIKESLLEPVAKRALWVLSACVAFVLLLACVNVANLVLARASTRQKEFAIRAALGASGGRLGRQMITECAVLAFAGALVGTLLAVWGVEVLVAALPDPAIPRKQDIAVDGRVLGFTAVLTVVTVLLFALVPGAAGRAYEHARRLEKLAAIFFGRQFNWAQTRRAGGGPGGAGVYAGNRRGAHGEEFSAPVWDGPRVQPAASADGAHGIAFDQVPQSRATCVFLRTGAGRAPSGARGRGRGCGLQCSV